MSRRAETDADSCAYVECTECGHPLERHYSRTGCDGEGCECDVRWTVQEIRAARKEVGLPAHFQRYNF